MQNLLLQCAQLSLMCFQEVGILVNFSTIRILNLCPFLLKKLSYITGKDKFVVLWSIEDHVTSAATDSKSGGSIIKPNSKSGEGNDKAVDSPSVGPRGIYSGHEDTVEDVAFSPSR